MRSLRISIFFLGILGFSLWTFLSGCDSQTDENRYIEEVVGEYRFNTFEFVPESSVLPPVNVLDTLVTEETRLQLFSSARFTLLYRFIGDDPAFVGGDFQATKSRVILKGNKEDEKFYVALLLPIEIELSRHPDNPDLLTAAIKRRVNLEAFSPRYKGLLSVRGTLVLELERQ